MSSTTVTLSPNELRLLFEALDSYVYWQLSDGHYRKDGEVENPGSDDEDAQAEIAACRLLQERLERL